jgi:hypothetical protein
MAYIVRHEMMPADEARYGSTPTQIGQVDEAEMPTRRTQFQHDETWSDEAEFQHDVGR